MTEILSKIPEKQLDFCRAIAKLCKDQKLRRFSGTFQPAWDDQWREDIVFSWDAGRHEEDVGQIHVNSTVRITAKIRDSKP